VALRPCSYRAGDELAADEARPGRSQLEVLAGIVGGPVPASLRGRAAWPWLFLNRVRVAAVPPAEGNAMIGELFPKDIPGA
jgi:hypothetical protein